MHYPTCRLAPAIAALALLAAPATAHDYRHGPLTITHPWSRATSPRAAVGAGFLAIHNSARQADRLVSAGSPLADRVEIHSMRTENGIMRMRRLPEGVVIPAGGDAILAPGGNHLMLIGLKRPLQQGEMVPATLRFEHGGTVAIAFKVEAADALQPAHAEHRP